MSEWQNVLYYGDNLDILRRYIKDETVDLTYLDPPFNSNANYNVLFAEKDGSKAASQIRAFEDTWTWDQEDEAVYSEIVTAGGKVADCLQAFRTFLGPCDMLAYLVMMAPRLAELRRVLKPTGSIYLHCDPTASHYLKILMDAIFGPTHFRNHIIWKRTAAHSAAQRWGPVHDDLLFYSKSDDFVWNQVTIEHTAEYTARYSHHDADGPRWADDNLTGPGVRHGDSGAVWRGFDPTSKASHWKVSSNAVQALVGVDAARNLSTTQKLDLLDKHGLIHWPQTRDGKGQGFPRFKRVLSAGAPIQDVITDVAPINSQAQERLGYPTQKPVALLERIIQASSNPGDLVLDIFCGCGTTIAAAQKLGRRWIGVDITHLAITLMKQRLKDAFAIEPTIKAAPRAEAPATDLAAAETPAPYASYRVIGEPVSLPDAEGLAKSDPYQFQWWALGLVGARPVEQKKGADKGIDGKIVFQGETPGKFETVILSVKAGHTNAAHVRDLKGVLERDKAAIGVLISMEEPTKPMREEAVTAGFYTSDTWGKKYPKMQLLTVAQLLDGRQIEMPPIRQVGVTFKKAQKVSKATTETQPDLDIR